MPGGTAGRAPDRSNGAANNRPGDPRAGDPRAAIAGADHQHQRLARRRQLLRRGGAARSAGEDAERIRGVDAIARRCALVSIASGVANDPGVTGTVGAACASNAASKPPSLTVTP